MLAKLVHTKDLVLWCNQIEAAVLLLKQQRPLSIPVMMLSESPADDGYCQLCTNEKYFVR
jgi:hypothetical protein